MSQYPQYNQQQDQQYQQPQYLGVDSSGQPQYGYVDPQQQQLYEYQQQQFQQQLPQGTIDNQIQYNPNDINSQMINGNPSNYSAYPEHLRTVPPPSGSYQGHVQHLTGWNDIPQSVFNSNNDNEEIQDPNVSNLTNEDIKNTIIKLNEDLINKNLVGQQSKIILDSKKRLETLYDKLNNDQLINSILNSLKFIAFNINSNDYNISLQYTVNILTNHIDENKWALGLKRLLEVALSNP